MARKTTSKLNVKVLNYLKRAFYDVKSPIFTGSIDRIVDHLRKKKNFSRMKISRTAVQKFLDAQDTHSMMVQPRKRKKKYNQTYSHFNLDQVQTDLVDLSRFKKSVNQKITFLMCIKDVMTKFAWVFPLLNKKQQSTVRAFQEFLNECQGQRPRCLAFDNGQEFAGKFKELLQENGICHFHPSNPRFHASVVETFNRSLKRCIFSYMTAFNTKGHYLSKLSDIVAGYNKSLNRSIGLSPEQARKTPADVLFKKLYGHPMSQKKPSKVKVHFRYKVGERVILVS